MKRDAKLGRDKLPDDVPLGWAKLLTRIFGVDDHHEPASVYGTASVARRGRRPGGLRGGVDGAGGRAAPHPLFLALIVAFLWIEPDGTTGVQQNAKLQVHGYGWPCHSSTLKHSFRLQFQAEYGASKLEWPMFTDSPADRFDSIALRAGGSKVWFDFRDPAQAQYLHDAFARDTARDMGKLDGHATYVHLYLDGLYWGPHMPVERTSGGVGAMWSG